jgi:transcriptional regulator with XRE-family HTH domain
MGRTDEPAERTPEPSREEVGARCRAARAYAGISQTELATRLEKLGQRVAVATIKRTEAGARKVPPEELLAIGEACEVPPWFMTRGIARWEANPVIAAVESMDAKLNALARAASAERIDALSKRVEHLDEGCTRLNQQVETLIESLAEAFETARDGRNPEDTPGS